jgi:chromosome segregation ATPase
MSRINKPMELVANNLIKIKEIAQSNTTLSKEVIDLEGHVGGLVNVVEGIIRDVSKKLAQNDSKDMSIEPKLKILKEMNESFDGSVQELQKKVDKLEEENKGFLAKNNKLKEKLATAEEEKKLLSDSVEGKQEVIDGLNEDNQRLRQKINELKDDYMYVLRAEETKRGAKDSYTQVEKADIPEGKAELCKDC